MTENAKIDKLRICLTIISTIVSVIGIFMFITQKMNHQQRHSIRMEYPIINRTEFVLERQIHHRFTAQYSLYRTRHSHSNHRNTITINDNTY